MEDIQGIPSSVSAEAALSSTTVQSITAPEITSTSISSGVGINSFIHAPVNKISLSKDKGKANTNPLVKDINKIPVVPLPPPSKWIKVKKKKSFQIAIALDNLVGDLVKDKKQHAFNMIGHFPGRTNFEVKQ